MLELEHCCDLSNRRQAARLMFARARTTQNRPPYTFECIPGGRFDVSSSYGQLDTADFSLFVILLVAASSLGWAGWLAFSGRSTEGTNTKYVAHVYCLPVAQTTWKIEFIIRRKLDIEQKVNVWPL